MFAKTIGINLIVALDTEGLDEAEIEWRTSFLNNQEFVDEVVLFNADIEKTILRIKSFYNTSICIFANVM